MLLIGVTDAKTDYFTAALLHPPTDATPCCRCLCFGLLAVRVASLSFHRPEPHRLRVALTSISCTCIEIKLSRHVPLATLASSVWSWAHSEIE